MRVTDKSLQDSYLINYQNTKARLKEIQTQLTTQSMVNVPSDNPLASAKIMRLNSQIDSIEMYDGNIDDGLSVMNNTITAMSGVQKTVEDVILKLTSLNNASADNSLNIYATQIDQAINTILDYANYEYDGNYLFSGTDFKSKPFAFNAGNTAINVVPADIGGSRKINISQTAQQKINMSGEELFQSVVKNLGNLDSTQANGTVFNAPVQKIYNPDGTEFNLTVAYTKTAANTYDMSYSVNTVPALNGTVNNLVFDPTTGKMSSMNGSTPNGVHITNSANKLDFVLDPSGLLQTNTASALTSEKNQDSDIMNTLISIRDGLKNGIRPTAQQVTMVNNFNKHIIGSLAEAGNIQNRLETTKELLNNQKLDITELLSKEKDVDMAKKVIELQTEEFNLNTVYKISSMILPKTLLDYL